MIIVTQYQIDLDLNEEGSVCFPAESRDKPRIRLSFTAMRSLLIAFHNKDFDEQIKLLDEERNKAGIEMEDFYSKTFKKVYFSVF